MMLARLVSFLLAGDALQELIELYREQSKRSAPFEVSIVGQSLCGVNFYPQRGSHINTHKFNT